MLIKARAWQFLSRGNIAEGPAGRFPGSCEDRTYKIELVVIAKPFPIDFASVAGMPPSAGAFAYVDPYIDAYAEQRWPKCILAEVSADIPDAQDLLSKLSVVVLDIHDLLSLGAAKHPHGIFRDQLSKRTGYRRSYYAPQDTDIRGIRQPNSSEHYCQVAPGAFLGPGVISIEAGGKVIEYVWSQIIPFPKASTREADLPRLKNVVLEMRKHVNSYNEFRDARSHLASGNVTGIKASIRSAASGVDAILRFYCAVHGIKFPKGGTFSEKLERILASTGMPSYASVAPDDAEKIAHLYRARNSMHEGDFYFNDDRGIPRHVDRVLAERFIEAAERLAIWLDAHA